MDHRMKYQFLHGQNDLPNDAWILDFRVFNDVIYKVFLYSIFADGVDILLVPKVAIYFGDIGMIEIGRCFYLSDYYLLYTELSNFPFIDYFEGT